MSRFAELQHRVVSMTELREIVGAMRSLSAARLQEAQQALQGLRSYADTMAAAICNVLLLRGPAPEVIAESGHRALVLYASEHGFVGGFNEHLIQAAAAILSANDRLFVLGSRGAALLMERGQELVWQRPMATRVSVAPDTINHLTNELYRQLSRGEISRVEVMFTRCRQGAATSIERRTLLPFDPAVVGPLPNRSPPLHNLASAELLERLLAEYVFALLTQGAAESIASENAARFAAMEAAHDNVSKRLVQLGQSVREARQDEITSELLDLLTGSSQMNEA